MDETKKLLIIVGCIQFISMFFTNSYFVILGIGIFIAYSLLITTESFRNKNYEDIEIIKKLLKEAFFASALSGFVAFCLFNVIKYIL